MKIPCRWLTIHGCQYMYHQPAPACTNTNNTATMTTPNDDLPPPDNADDLGSDGEEEDEATKAAKRRERLEQNRISARESRKRKKNMIEELQRTVIALSRENKVLNERNETLRRELVEIGTKNPGVVSFIFMCCVMF